MRNIIILAILTSTMLISTAFSQNQNQVPSAKLFVSGGYHFLDMTDLNSSLSSHFYPEVPHNYFSIGVDYQIYDNQLIRDMEFLWFIKGKGTSGNYESGINGFMYLFNMGYMALNLDSIHLYPLVGIGIGNISMTVTETSSPTFDSMLSGTPQNLRMSKTGFIINAGLGLDFVLGGNNGNPEFFIGLRGGYIYYPADNDWSANNITVSSGPSTSLSGGYVRIMLGIGDMETSQ